MKVYTLPNWVKLYNIFFFFLIFNKTRKNASSHPNVGVAYFGLNCYLNFVGILIAWLCFLDKRSLIAFAKGFAKPGITAQHATLQRIHTQFGGIFLLSRFSINGFHLLPTIGENNK